MLKGCAAALGRQARFRVLQVFRVFAFSRRSEGELQKGHVMSTRRENKIM
jgi:hypothetical protein